MAGAVGAGNIASGMLTETTGCALAICASVDRPTYIHVDGNLARLHEPAIVEILPKALKVHFPPP